jgi:hypothetical protein
VRASLPGTLESYYVQLTHARQCLLSALAILTYFSSPFASPVGPWVFFRSSPAKKWVLDTNGYAFRLSVKKAVHLRHSKYSGRTVRGQVVVVRLAEVVAWVYVRCLSPPTCLAQRVVLAATDATAHNAAPRAHCPAAHPCCCSSS